MAEYFPNGVFGNESRHVGTIAEVDEKGRDSQSITD